MSDNERPEEGFEDFPSLLPRDPCDIFTSLIEQAKGEAWDPKALHSLLRTLETAHAGLVMAASSAWSIFLAHDDGGLTDEEAARLAVEVVMLQCHRLGEDLLEARDAVPGEHPHAPLLGPWGDYLDYLEEERGVDVSAARTRSDDEARKGAGLELLEEE